ETSWFGGKLAAQALVAGLTPRGRMQFVIAGLPEWLTWPYRRGAIFRNFTAGGGPRAICVDQIAAPTYGRAIAHNSISLDSPCRSA
ncbi:MAG: hypothetical protein ACK4G5_03955, partial [Devosia sp.]